MTDTTRHSDNKTIPFGHAVYGIYKADSFFNNPRLNHSVTYVYFPEKNRQLSQRYNQLMKENLTKDNTIGKIQDSVHDITTYLDLYRTVIYKSLQTINFETADSEKDTKNQIQTLMALNSPDITIREPSRKQTWENLKHGDINKSLMAGRFLVAHFIRYPQWKDSAQPSCTPH